MTVLRQRMTEDMQVRNLSPHTQASYLQQVSLFARYFLMSPDALTPEHIRTYQIYLTNEKRLAPNSIHTAVAALRFLYRITLKKNWTFGEDIPLRLPGQSLPRREARSVPAAHANVAAKGHPQSQHGLQRSI